MQKNIKKYFFSNIIRLKLFLERTMPLFSRKILFQNSIAEKIYNKIKFIRHMIYDHSKNKIFKN